ncbi:hypothetical protein [Corynebacterium vitaeruminis]|uniref:hypothetical protein n=1 Tax=Corynebacterium vitaeruminis TaxID=38305 RepID=UPI0005569FEB|nr:hypothetical protein [Corynebacterium vitaeruminis]
MVATTLNDRQKTVLAWIDAGCPAEATPLGNYKISARMLESHELVKINGHGDTWKATITARGKRVLAGSEPLRKPRKKGAQPTVSVPTRPETPNHPRVVPTDAETETLLEAIRQAPRGFFRIKCDKEKYETQWEPRLKAVERAISQTTPTLRLAYSWHEGSRWSRLPSHLVSGLVEEVTFTQQSKEILADTRKVGKYHPMLAHFEAGKNFQVSREVALRAKRLLHVLCTEAAREGWTVEYKVEEPRSWQPNPKGSVRIGHGEVKIIEQYDKFEREPTKQEIDDHNRYSWTRDRPMKKLYNHVPNGRLTLEIGYSKLNDTKRSPTRLDDVLEGYFTQQRIASFYSRSYVDLEELIRRSFARRVDRAAAIVGKRVAEQFELEVLSQQASEFEHYRQLVDFVGKIEDEGGADPVYVEWCRTVLERENPVPELRVPTPPPLDRAAHEDEIESVARTLDDPEFSAWTPVSFEGLAREEGVTAT